MKIDQNLPPIHKTMPDGEHRLCRHCYKKGYGDDSYHPITDEFWPKRHGRLDLGQCSACKSEADCKRHGSRHGVIPSDFKLPPRTIPYAHSRDCDALVHGVCFA